MRLTCFILLIACTFFGLFSHAAGTINLLTTPSLLCEQDVVEFNCTLSSGVTYASSLASLNINGSATCITAPNIFNGAVPRLSFTSIGGSTTAPAAQYTISPFLSQDNATRYRCCADNSAAPFNTEFTPYLSLPLAAPPSATSVSISFPYDSAISCTGTITLTWLAVASDRAVTSYEVLLNGTVDGTTGATTYTIGTLNLLEHYATYTVMATSCAGSSTSLPVIFTPLTPAPPFSASVNISTTYNSANTCTGTITLTWLAVASDRNVTSYEVLLNGTTISTISTPMAMNSYTTGTLNLIEHYATYTVIATSCAGSSISSPVMFTPPIIATVPITTSTTNSDTLTTTSISSTTQTTTVPTTTPTLPITTSTLPITTTTLPITTTTLPITTYTTNFDNVTLTAVTTSPVNTISTPNITTINNSSTLPTSVPPYQAYCYLPCTTSTDCISSTPDIATTNYTPLTTGSSITNDATSDALSCNTTPYLVGIIILVLLLLLSILVIVILILFIIYSSKKNNSAPKKQQNTNTDDPTNTAHIYNYIDLNALAETNEEKHYYSEMATIVQSNTNPTTTSNTNPTTASTTTTNDDTNDRAGYYNVSTYAYLS